ncbi:MAG: hypothetical protein LC790_13505, partial [Actinobacteria bacterium]|nr:hypothetical protein [Actinomycetota bacterium]
MLGNGHVRFGGRVGETDRRQRRHRAPTRPTTELRYRWLVAQRRSSGSGWCMHDGDHATLHDARTYIERIADVTPLGCHPSAVTRRPEEATPWSTAPLQPHPPPSAGPRRRRARSRRRRKVGTAVL